MASVNKSAHSASKSSRGYTLTVMLSALLSCGVLAGSAWGVVSTVGAMRDAARLISFNDIRLDAPRHAATKVSVYRRPVLQRAAKSVRLVRPSETEIQRRQLTAEAIRSAHRRGLATRLALAEKHRKADSAAAETKVALATRSLELEQTTGGKPSLVTALAEDIPVGDMQPFGLVLAKPDPEEAALPARIPLPEARPLIETVTAEEPADEKPVARLDRDRATDRKDRASENVKRSLFGDLFKSKSNETGWLGKGTKVAIYDVSNATVYLPDGTKLRAHSGIGNMRDNPRYEHVKMRGPTPAGIYRLSMREKRFYGVEAIRMTSIDGRDPKNRTGLLTHTNLLRGRTGSHGCIAFQNYQPFLRAFKRGQVTMIVVVPELPRSRTEIAALYRKAGA